MPDHSVSEQRPAECPGGHAYVGGQMIVGWEPCGCTRGHHGHRTYWCLRCGRVLEVPPCVRVETATSRYETPRDLALATRPVTVTVPVEDVGLSWAA
jgi:hypothetical protein